jgi:hypothetical protein
MWQQYQIFACSGINLQADRSPACIVILSRVVLGSLGLGLLPSLLSMVAELFCAGGVHISRGVCQV